MESERTNDAPSPRPRGRPRSETARQAILDAARETLEEGGLLAVTMEGVAARAGVGKPTVYRHWSNRYELAMAALIAASGEVAAPAAGAAPVDALRAQLHQMADLFASGTGRHVAAVIASGYGETELSKAFRSHFVQARREEGRTLLQARDRGRRDPRRHRPRDRARPGLRPDLLSPHHGPCRGRCPLRRCSARRAHPWSGPTRGLSTGRPANSPPHVSGLSIYPGGQRAAAGGDEIAGEPDPRALRAQVLQFGRERRIPAVGRLLPRKLRTLLSAAAAERLAARPDRREKRYDRRAGRLAAGPLVTCAISDGVPVACVPGNCAAIARANREPSALTSPAPRSRAMRLAIRAPRLVVKAAISSEVAPVFAQIGLAAAGRASPRVGSSSAGAYRRPNDGAASPAS